MGSDLTVNVGSTLSQSFAIKVPVVSLPRGGSEAKGCLVDCLRPVVGTTAVLRRFEEERESKVVKQLLHMGRS